MLNYYYYLVQQARFQNPICFSTSRYIIFTGEHVHIWNGRKWTNFMSNLVRTKAAEISFPLTLISVATISFWIYGSRQSLLVWVDSFLPGDTKLRLDYYKVEAMRRKVQDPPKFYEFFFLWNSILSIIRNIQVYI